MSNWYQLNDENDLPDPSSHRTVASEVEFVTTWDGRKVYRRRRRRRNRHRYFNPVIIVALITGFTTLMSLLWVVVNWQTLARDVAALDIKWMQFLPSASSGSGTGQPSPSANVQSASSHRETIQTSTSQATAVQSSPSDAQSGEDSTATVMPAITKIAILAPSFLITPTTVVSSSSSAGGTPTPVLQFGNRQGALVTRKPTATRLPIQRATTPSTTTAPTLVIPATLRATTHAANDGANDVSTSVAPRTVNAESALQTPTATTTPSFENTATSSAAVAPTRTPSFTPTQTPSPTLLPLPTATLTPTEYVTITPTVITDVTPTAPNRAATIAPSPTTVPLVNLAPRATISAPAPAPDSRDTCRPPNITNYGPANLNDGEITTAWRMSGAGRNARLRFDFGAPVVVHALNIVPGYAKTDPCTPALAWCMRNRIPKTIIATFSSGSRQTLDFRQSCTWQGVTLDSPVKTTWIEFMITETYPPRDKDFTPISEITILGEDR